MSDIVIVALITLVGTIISGVIGIASANKVISIKIDELTKKVEKHNGLVDRMYKVESKIELIQADINELKEETHEKH